MEWLRRKDSFFPQYKYICIQGHILLEFCHFSHKINFSLLTIVMIIACTLHGKQFSDVPVVHLHLNKNLTEQKTEGKCVHWRGCLLPWQGEHIRQSSVSDAYHSFGLVPKVTITGNHFFLPQTISLLKALEAAQNSTDLGELSRIHYVTKILH